MPKRKAPKKPNYRLGTFKPGRRVRLAGPPYTIVTDSTGQFARIPVGVNPRGEADQYLAIPVGTVAEIIDVPMSSTREWRVRWAMPGLPVTFAKEAALQLLPGRPAHPLLDGAVRDGFSGHTRGVARTAPAVPSPVVSPSPEAPAMQNADVLSALEALKNAIAANAATPAPAALDEDRVRAIAEDLDAKVRTKAMAAYADVAAEVDALRQQVRPVLDLASRMVDPVVRGRVALAAAATGNPILDALRQVYTPGVDAAANVMLAAPPSIGKTYSVREFARIAGYDAFVEHGCTSDLSEWDTVLGTVTADGKGGFVTLDGVLTSAVRRAASGERVLFLFDEVLRLGERVQEALLSFLTGVKLPNGERVYRLRTRQVQGATWEVIECPAANLHFVAATNLGAVTPVQAFWSRWLVRRIAFDATTVHAVAASIAASYGIADPDAAAKVFTEALVKSRQFVSTGELKFPLDLRNFERACATAASPDAAGVLAGIIPQVSDTCAHWSVDDGELDPASTAAVAAVAKLLLTATVAANVAASVAPSAN